jgi:cytochrome P450
VTSAGGPDLFAVRTDYDPHSAAQRSDPHSLYERLRSEAPVFFSPIMNAWVLTRYDDVVLALTDTRRFSAKGSIGIDAFETFPSEVQAVLQTGPDRFPGLIELDPPVHSSYRSLVNLAFTPRRVAALEPRIRQISDDLVDRFATVGWADLAVAFAFPFPMVVICEILGVPKGDMRAVQTMADGFRAMEAGNMWQLSVAEQVAVAESFVAFQRYAAELVDDRRAHPHEEDLLTTLLSAQLGGERSLTTEELVSSVIHLLFAGTETTARMITSAVWHLLSERKGWEQIASNPVLAANAVEETLRMEPPVIYHSRITREPVSFGNVEIPAGAIVHLLFSSANRDEGQFTHSGRFDLERDGLTRHLGFGRGPHFCVGAPIGRLEGRLALEILVHRLPTARLAQGFAAVPEDHLMLRGLQTLELEWDPASSRPRTTPTA